MQTLVNPSSPPQVVLPWVVGRFDSIHKVVSRGQRRLNGMECFCTSCPWYVQEESRGCTEPGIEAGDAQGAREKLPTGAVIQCCSLIRRNVGWRQHLAFTGCVQRGWVGRAAPCIDAASLWPRKRPQGDPKRVRAPSGITGPMEVGEMGEHSGVALRF